MHVSQDIREAKAMIEATSGRDDFSPREVREMRDQLIAMTFKAEFEHILRRELSKECGPSVFAHAMRVATSNAVQPRNEFEAAIDRGDDVISFDMLQDAPTLDRRFAELADVESEPGGFDTLEGQLKFAAAMGYRRDF